MFNVRRRLTREPRILTEKTGRGRKARKGEGKSECTKREIIVNDVKYHWRGQVS